MPVGNISKNISVSIAASANGQDVLTNHPELRQMLMNGTVSLLATQPAGATPLTVTFQVGTEYPAKDSIPNPSGNSPSQLNGDTIVNNHPAYIGTPIIFTASNSSGAAVVLSAQMVQQPAILR